ncbi:hypothetical protein ACN1C3_30160 [Pseudomonas sp. H11T01]|uniref:hypothetical protein n=1 Tax=Pseudomonas sp. H11T01 TaxID=3402749 RepID=UPI003AC59AF5
MHPDIEVVNTIKVSLGKTKFDNLPKQCEESNFDDFTNAVLDKANESAAKGETFICSPMAVGRHSNPEKWEGEAPWRQKRLVQPRCFLPLDCDGFDSLETYGILLGYLKRYQGFAYTTASHTPEAPRCRVVLAQTRATDREDGIALCKAVQALIERDLGVGAVKFDQSVYKGEQPLYTPVQGAEAFRFTGQPVDVEAVLAQPTPATKKPKAKAHRVKTDDPILCTLNELNMVRADQGGGAYLIECPFEDQHTMDGGDGETIYYQKNTNHYAQEHFHCFHSHCSEHSDNAFMVSLLARYSKQTGKKAGWGVASPMRKATAPEEVDKEFAELLKTAPKALQAYVDWFTESALMPHPVYAMFSALLLMMQLIGPTVKGPRGSRINLWILFLAHSEMGKKAIIDLALKAAELLKKLNYIPCIPNFERDHASASSLWWSLADHDSPQQIIADEELGQTICHLIAARPGSEYFKLRKTLLHVYGCANDAYVAPTRYTQSGGVKKAEANKMPDIHYPFVEVFGSGTLNTIPGLSADASDEGTTNRFCVVIETAPTEIGDITTEPGVLPDALIKQVEKLHQLALKNPLKEVMEAELEHTAEGVRVVTNSKTLGMSREQPRELKFYDGFNDDWRAEVDYGRKRAQTLLDIWGRHAEKVIKLAMIAALFDSGDCVSKANFKWAASLMRWNNERSARQYKATGGGAANDEDRVRNAFLAFFDSEKGRAYYKENGHIASGFLSRQCSAWKRNAKLRWSVVSALIDEGLIVLVDLKPSGEGYQKGPEWLET